MIGYTKAHRKEFASDIWAMPPLYHRVWFWLRQKAKFKAEEFPTRKGFGIWLLPGQLLTSYDLIAQGVSWTEYGLEKTPNKKTIKTVVDWLISQEMAEVESNAHGTWINLCNYKLYNSAGGEEGNAKETQKKRTADTIKEVQESKEVSKDLKTYVESDFQKLWSMYPKKDGRKAALRHFLATVKTDKAWVDINIALENYLLYIKEEALDLQFTKNGSTWFNNWPDWVEWKSNGNGQHRSGNGAGARGPKAEPDKYDGVAFVDPEHEEG